MALDDFKEVPPGLAGRWIENAGYNPANDIARYNLNPNSINFGVEPAFSEEDWIEAGGLLRILNEARTNGEFEALEIQLANDTGLNNPQDLLLPPGLGEFRDGLLNLSKQFSNRIKYTNGTSADYQNENKELLLIALSILYEALDHISISGFSAFVFEDSVPMALRLVRESIIQLNNLFSYTSNKKLPAQVAAHINAQIKLYEEYGNHNFDNKILLVPVKELDSQMKADDAKNVILGYRKLLSNLSATEG